MKKEIFLLILLIFGILIYFYNAETENFIAPDETILKFFGENYANTGKLYYEQNNSDLSFSRVRGTYLIENKIVPLKFLGFPLFFGIFSLFGLYSILTTLCALLILVYTYYLSKIVFKKEKLSIISVGIILFLPFLLYWEKFSFFENVSATSFLLISFYYYLKLNKNKSCTSFLISSLFLAISLSFRYDLIIPAIVFFIPFCINVLKIPKKYLFYALIIFLISFIPILIVSYQTYNNPFDFGEKILSNNYNIEKSPSLNNIFNYFSEIIKFVPIFFLFFISLFDKKIYKNSIQKKIRISYLLYIIIFSFIIIFPNPIKHPNILHESYTRYFLFFFIISSILLANSILNIRNKKLQIFSFFIIFIVFLNSIVIPFQRHESNINENKETLNIIINNTQKEEFIILWESDKFIFPERKTLSVELFLDKNKNVNYSDFSLFINNQINKNKFIIYIKELDKEKIIYYLSKNNLTLKSINNNYELYEIKKQI